MNVKLNRVDLADKQLLEKMILEYQKEILNVENVGRYKYLDSYWEDHGRTAFFVELNGKIVGFALVNSYCVLEESAKSISEFYIKKEFRNKGLGKYVVTKIFELFPGRWEIRELRDNVIAQQFWRKVIKGYTEGQFKEVALNNEKWSGLVQTFDNSNYP